MGEHLKRLVVVTELKKEVRLNGLKFHSEYLNFINEELKKMVAKHATTAKNQGAKMLDPKLLKVEEVKQ
jgi:histidine ammonia-lyase